MEVAKVRGPGSMGGGGGGGGLRDDNKFVKDKKTT
jgi:hypothetical protein